MKPALRAVDANPKPAGWGAVHDLLSRAEKLCALTPPGDGQVDSVALRARARALVLHLKNQKRSAEVKRCARIVHDATKVALRQLRVTKLEGDEEKKPTLAEEIAAWVKLASAASGIFGGVMSFVMLWLLYKVLVEK